MRSERNALLTDIFVGVAERMYGLNSLDSSEDNLSNLNKHLEEGSSVVYFNHISLIDPPNLLAYLKYHLTNIDNIAIAASQRHYDVKKKPYVDGLAIRLAPLVGVEILPVVQRKDKGLYSASEQTRLARNFIARSRNLLSLPGGVLVVAPEGTRSEDGKLQKVESGFERMGRFGRVKYLPIAIIPEGEFSRGLRMSKVSFKVGEPFDINELDMPPGSRKEDAAMLKLAELLPMHMRGVYAPYV